MMMEGEEQQAQQGIHLILTGGGGGEASSTLQDQLRHIETRLADIDKQENALAAEKADLRIKQQTVARHVLLYNMSFFPNISL